MIAHRTGPLRRMLFWAILMLMALGANASTVDKALQARQEGDLGLAIKILRDLNLREPTSARVQLELARALFEQGDYRGAKSLLDQALSRPLPAPVRNNAESFRLLVEQRLGGTPTPGGWQNYVSLGLGSSDRFVVLSDHDLDQTGGVSFDPFRGRNQLSSDGFAQAAWRSSFRPGQRYGWLFDGYARYRDYFEVNSADSRWVQLQGGYRFPATEDHSFDVILLGRQLGIGGRTSFESLGAGVSWEWAGPTWPVRLSTQWSERRYQEIVGRDPRNGERTEVELAQAGWLDSTRWRWRWAARFQDYDADAPQFDYDIWEGVAAVDYAPAPRWVAKVEASYSDVRFIRPESFDGQAPTFQPSPPPGFELRQADRWQLRLSGQYRFNERWLGELGVTGFFYEGDPGLTDEPNQSEWFMRLFLIL